MNHFVLHVAKIIGHKGRKNKSRGMIMKERQKVRQSSELS